MHTITYLLFMDAFDHAAGNFDAFGYCLTFGGGCHFIDQILRDKNPGDIFIHETGHGGGGQQNDTGQNFYLKLSGVVHEFFKPIQVINGLGLDKLGAGLDLFFKFDQLRFQRVRLGRDDGAGTE
jgi:hypothetical protein